jgi:hypothetical protein
VPKTLSVVVHHITNHNAGADPGFQVREGVHLKKLCRAEGGANIFRVFRGEFATSPLVINNSCSYGSCNLD